MLKRTIVSLFALAVTLLMAACGGNTGLPKAVTIEPVNAELPLTEQARSLRNEVSCSASGGVWQKVGRAQMFACVLPARDAGQACSDNSDCQVSCLVTGRDVKAGTAVTGQCAANTNQFGCKTRVRNGRAEPTLCVD